MRKFIFVTFDVVGFHKWENAPDRRAYLRDLHRHLFGVRVELQVSQNEREVEFHDFLDFCKNNIVINETDSCETIAENLVEKIVKAYSGNREVICSVSEDGENGAIIRFEYPNV